MEGVHSLYIVRTPVTVPGAVFTLKLYRFEMTIVVLQLSFTMPHVIITIHMTTNSARFVSRTISGSVSLVSR